MRKFAMTTIAAATLLVGGLTGCGVDNQAGDMGGGTFRGAGAGTGHAPTVDNRGMTGARYTGEGPITDMFTRDDETRRGGVTGYGVDQKRGTPIHGGQLGVQDRNGLGNTNNRTGYQGPGVFGQDRGQRDTGLFGQDRGQRGTGLLGDNNRMGERGMTGITGGYRGMGGDPGFTGQRMNGARGITGDERPGMVDDQGILRGQRNRAMDAKQGTTRGQAGQQAGQNDQVQEIKRIVDGTGNIKNSQVVIHGDAVMIGIESDGQNSEALKNKIKQQVERQVQGLDVYVITDREQVKQLRTMNERLQNGGANKGTNDGAMEEVGDTVTEMTRDLGRAVKRPIERNQ